MSEIKDLHSPKKPGFRSFANRYPPLLIGIALIVFLAVAVLPSSLRNPLTNPTQTPEYAPVSGEDTNNPPGGNFASFGLSGGGRGIGAGGQSESPLDSATALGKNPSTKRCVGKPPRQTEDRLSPPCVAFFEGNNFGATYPGVSKDEVRVLIYADLEDVHPTGSIVDLGKPPNPDPDTRRVAALRTWQTYFNTRFQTYGRFVHFFAYSSGGRRVEDLRAQAADGWSKVKPFAAVSSGIYTLQSAYLEAMADRGVVSFANTVRLSASVYQGFPKRVWGYDPTVEYYAENFASYVCRKVVPHPVSFTGNPLDEGEPRRLGLLHTSNTNTPAFELAKAVKSAIEGCGGSFVDEKTYPQEGSVVETGQGDSRANAEAMASFRQNGVTTIIWPGINVGATDSAAAIGYRPEWIQLGVGGLEGNNYAQLQEQTVWRYAWLFGDLIRQIRPEDTPCWQAYRETAGDDSDRVDQPPNGLTRISSACSRVGSFYPAFLQLFTGIQVAGPRLTPESMDKGYRAIPQKASTDPFIPACFYLPDDYTCVKDGVIEWWDPSGEPHPDQGESADDGANRPGCWRMPQEGRRYLKDGWPEGNITAQKQTNDPCNTV